MLICHSFLFELVVCCFVLFYVENLFAKAFSPHPSPKPWSRVTERKLFTKNLSANRHEGQLLYFLRVQYIRHCIEGARLVLPKLWVKRQETTVLTAYYQYEFRVIARNKPRLAKYCLLLHWSDYSILLVNVNL